MHLSDLATPAVLVEQRRLFANLDAMQSKADEQGVALRPHIKTHKSVWLANQQKSRGARGLTVAKVGEAETFAAAGFDDIRIAYAVVGRDKYERIAALLPSCRISFCIDTEAGARAASEFFAAEGLTVDVLVETDIGYGRCGVLYNQPASVQFAKWADGLPGLNVCGILTHAGNSYWGPIDGSESRDQALQRVATMERDRMLQFASALREAGLSAFESDSFEISIGSTPSMKHFTNRTEDGLRVTEIRPGNYVYLDMTQVNLGVEPIDRCAMTVLATVISRQENANGSSRAFLDSGKKVLTSDKAFESSGYGQILVDADVMQPLQEAIINSLSEEHGWVKMPGETSLNVLDRVRVVPNHACVVVNTQKQLWLVDGDEVLQALPVDAQSLVV